MKTCINFCDKHTTVRQENEQQKGINKSENKWKSLGIIRVDCGVLEEYGFGLCAVTLDTLTAIP